jgi:mannose-6-phosphate isomerase-like protein (cupin superfamily)
MQKFLLPGAAGVAVLVIIAPLLAQAPAPATPSPTQAPARAPTPRPRATAPTQVIVRTNSGNPVEGVRVTLSGRTGTQAQTDAKGMSAITLPAGSYRFRFEHEDFVTLERDVTVGASQPTEVAVALNRAFTPPPPPPPAPEPPRPLPALKPVVAAGPPTNMSLPQFLEKNYIGRDPLKESVVGCTAAATTRILQLRDSLAPHTHDDLDETLYVVAGEGAIRIKDEMITISPGSLTVIPRGQPHSTERHGKNPLILLSTLSGAPCQAAAN